MTWVPSLTQEAGNKGEVEEVAQITMSAARKATSMSDGLSKCSLVIESEARAAILTAGYRTLNLFLRDTARSLSWRWTIVHRTMEGKCGM